MSRVEISFLGGASEVGRLGMVLRYGGSTLLFDYGLQPHDPPRYPMEAPPVDALLLTHSHLDHCGMVPVITRNSTTDLLTTSATAEVTDILLQDSLKISQAEGYPQPFSKKDLDAMHGSIVTIDQGDVLDLEGVEVKVHPAGHIPGSCMFELSLSDTLLFSGDLQTIDTHLMRGATPVPCDILVMESTYAGRRHPDRAQTEKAFLEQVDEVVDGGGIAVVPCFAVARTQEILMILAEANHEVWLDGMGREVSQTYLRHPSQVRSYKEFKRALHRCRVVHSARGRERALRGEVIVTTGGMLDGGPVLHYLSRIKDDPRSAILLTGYQVEGTNGRRLLEEGVVELYGAPAKVNCPIHYFDFSAHAGHDQLVEFVDGCDPSTVVLMHGDNREELSRVLEGRECLLPKEGEWYEL